MSIYSRRKQYMSEEPAAPEAEQEAFASGAPAAGDEGMGLEEALRALREAAEARALSDGEIIAMVRGVSPGEVHSSAGVPRAEEPGIIARMYETPEMRALIKKSMEEPAPAEDCGCGPGEGGGEVKVVYPAAGGAREALPPPDLSSSVGMSPAAEETVPASEAVIAVEPPPIIDPMPSAGLIPEPAPSFPVEPEIEAACVSPSPEEPAVAAGAETAPAAFEGELPADIPMTSTVEDVPPPPTNPERAEEASPAEESADTPDMKSVFELMPFEDLRGEKLAEGEKALRRYKREDAVEYARKWALSRNPQYAAFDELGGDCTNFASQVLAAGGCPMNFTQTYGWYYRGPSARSPAWTGSEYLYNFLTRSQGVGPVGREADISELEPGDIVQLSFNGKYFQHSPVVVRVAPNPSKPEHIFVSAHTMDADARQLSTYIWRKARYIKILGYRSN